MKNKFDKEEELIKGKASMYSGVFTLLTILTILLIIGVLLLFFYFVPNS